MTALLLAGLLAGTPETGSLGLLVDRVAVRLTTDFAAADRRVERTEPGRVVLSPGGLHRGTELEVLTEALPLRDPGNFEEMGALLKPIARARVVAENDKLCLAELKSLPGEPAPHPGDLARVAPGSFDLGLRAGPVSAELEPVQRALLLTLPYRLKQTGLFAPRSLAANAPADLAGLRADAAAQGLDAIVSLSLFRTEGQLALLVEVVAAEPEGLTDLYATSVPWDLEADLITRAASLARLGPSAPGTTAYSRELPGEVLALVTLPAVEDRPVLLAALTSEALWTDLDAATPRRLARLADLEPAAVPVRRRAGSLVSHGSDGTIAFGANTLAHGYLLSAGKLIPLDGVPVARLGESLLLARYLPGEDVFDGTLRAGAVEHDIGPFLRLVASGRGFVVERPDLKLEVLEPDFASHHELPLESGDVWDTADGTWLISARLAAGSGEDELRATTGDGKTRTLRFAQAVSAAVLVSAPTAGVAVAETGAEGTSRVSLLTFP